jgi:hypothetical protein
VFSFYFSFVGLIFSETLYSMALIFMIHDKGKLFTIVDSTARHFESKFLTLKLLYSPKKFASLIYFGEMYKFWTIF